MKAKPYIFFYTLVFLLNTSLFSQDFKILEKNNSFVILDFELDTIQLKKIAYNKDSIDFKDYFYCVNRNKSANLPIFNYVFGIEDSSLAFSIQNVSSLIIPIRSIKINSGVKKRKSNQYSNQQVNCNLITLNEPYVYKSFIGQTINILPITYDSLNSYLNCVYKLTIKVYKVKKNNNQTHSKTYEKSYSSKLNKHFFDFKQNRNRKVKSLNNYTSEMLILCQDSNKLNGQLIANWKNQKGLKTNIINLKGITEQSKIKDIIKKYYDSISSLEYVLFLGNQNEIPAYYYGYIDGDDNYSDSYYGQMSNDLYPEIYVGRITGNTKEINQVLQKSIFYEKENFEGDWMMNSIGVASNEGGINDGDNNEADWQHLRIIKSKLHSFGYKNVFEFYDGDHGGEDVNGSPDKINIIEAINKGASIFNYTGHGDNNLMLTGQLTSNDIKNLNNKNKNPFIISVACNNGKFIYNTGCIAETFLKCNDDANFTGAIAFCGSTILMDWSPPMCTQDEIVNSITTIDSVKNQLSIGELFYSSQAKMLDKYGDLGKGVMETWILFGDPSLDLKTKKPEPLLFSYNLNKNENKITIDCLSENILLGISSLNMYVNSYILKKGINEIILDSLTDNFIFTFSKPNFITKQIEINTNNLNSITKNSEILIFPNPINSNLNTNEISIKNTYHLKEIILLDIYGKLILNNEVNFQSDINLKLPENLNKGVYFIRFIDNQNRLITKKIEII